MLLEEAVTEAKGLVEQVEEEDPESSFHAYRMAYTDGIKWLLGMLAECDDIEEDALT